MNNFSAEKAEGASGGEAKKKLPKKSAKLPKKLDPHAYTVSRSEEEQMCVDQTRELINKKSPGILRQYRDDDHKLSRIVMRKHRPKNGYNIPKAARFFAETVAWRKEHHIEHVRRFPPEALQVANLLLPDTIPSTTGRSGKDGIYDRNGHPV